MKLDPRLDDELRNIELGEIDLINNDETESIQQSDNKEICELVDIVFCIDVTQDMSERLPKIKLF